MFPPLSGKKEKLQEARVTLRGCETTPLCVQRTTVFVGNKGAESARQLWGVWEQKRKSQTEHCPRIPAELAWTWRSISRFTTANKDPSRAPEHRTPVTDVQRGTGWPQLERPGLQVCPAASRSRQVGSPCCRSPSSSWLGWPGSAPGSSPSSVLRASFTSSTLGEFLLLDVEVVWVSELQHHHEEASHVTQPGMVGS